MAAQPLGVVDEVLLVFILIPLGMIGLNCFLLLILEVLDLVPELLLLGLDGWV
jgi:hypothetical protein